LNITNTNPNVKGYKISNGNKIQTTTSKTYNFKGLTKDTEYTFTVSTLYKDNVVKISPEVVTIKTLAK
jgi:chitodextrinase